MAKKRKVKAKARRKVKTVRAPKVPAARERPVTAVQAEHILGLVGGLLVVIAAIISIIGAMDVISSAVSLVLGALMILLIYTIKRSARISAIFLLVLSIVTLVIAPHGFIIGPVLGLIGAIIVLARGK